MTKEGYNSISRCRSTKQSHTHTKDNLSITAHNIQVSISLQTNIINQMQSSVKKPQRKPSKIMLAASRMNQHIENKGKQLGKQVVSIPMASQSKHKQIVYTRNISVGPSAIQQTTHNLTKLNVKTKFRLKLSKSKQLAPKTMQQIDKGNELERKHKVCYFWC